MKRYFFVLLLLLIYLQAFSQQIKYGVQNFNTENGLLNNEVLNVFIDSENFTWICTNSGLQMYDGNNFTNYRNEPSDSTTIIDNSIRLVAEGHNGKIWVSTVGNGFDIYDKKTNSFSRFNPSEIAIPTEKLSCWNSFIDKDKNLWFKLLETYKEKYANTFLVVDTLYKSKLVDITWSDANYVIKDKAYLIMKTIITIMNSPYQTEDDKYSLFYPQYKLVHSSCVMNEYIWLGTENQILCFDTKTNTFSTIYDFLANIGIKNISGYDWVDKPKAMYCDFEGNLWVAVGTYLYKIELSNGKFEKHSYITNDITNRDVIVKINGNKEGILWVSYRNKGLTKVNLKTQKFKHFNLEKDIQNSLTGNTIRSLYADKDNIWVGTFSRGLNRYNFSTQKFGYFKLTGNETTKNAGYSIKSITKDKNNRLWLATGESNKVFYSDNHFSATDDVVFNNFDIGEHTKVLYVDPTGRLWLGTKNNLYLFEPEKNKFFKVHPDLINANIICCLYEAPNILWLGTWLEGLIKLTLNTNTNKERIIDSIKWFKKDDKDRYSISDNRVMTLNFDKDSTLWIGTWSQGIMKKFNIDGKTRFRSFDIRSGLSENCVYGILNGKNNDLWISTHSGLNSFNLKSNTFKSFFDSDGLPSNAFIEGAYCNSPDGNLLFGGTNGLIMFNPDSIELAKDFSPVLINNLKILNNKVHPGDSINNRVVLHTDIKYTKELILNHEDKIFSLEFISIDYTNSEKINYSYKLEGFNDNWLYTDSKKRYVTFSNLPHGEYIFKVKSTNRYGEWNKTPTQLRIIVLPSFWETKKAYVLYFAVLLLILYAFRSYLLTRAAYKNNLKISSMEKENLQKLNQMKLRFFTNITHEFKTPLTLILGPLEKLLLSHQWADNVKKQLLVMHRSGNRLLQLIEQLMDFRKMETGNMKLKISKNDITTHIEEVTSIFNVHAEQNMIKYNVFHNLEKVEVWFDKNILETVVYNLLSNAFKFTAKDGEISIYIRLLPQNKELADLKNSIDEQLEIVVKDNGTGISKNRLNSIFDRFYQVNESEILKRGTGIGLSLCKELIDLHKGYITVDSIKGKGTTFKVVLPVNKSKFNVNEIVTLKQNNQQSIPALKKKNSKNHFLPIDIRQLEEKRHKPDEKSPLLLIVEDNKEVNDYIVGVLADKYRVEVAYNGKDGLDKAAELAPDLIISDIMMPVMDGIELCRKLKTSIHTSHIPVILLTALTTIEDKITGIETGADAYLPKPFNVRHLETRIRKLIEIRQKLKIRFSEQTPINPKEVTVSSIDEKFLEKVIGVIEENISNTELTVELIGKEIGMSSTHLYRKIKVLTGFSTNEFVRNFRLKRAAQLIKQKVGNVNEIMYDVGFSNRSYFAKCFKQIFGQSPKEYGGN